MPAFNEGDHIGSMIVRARKFGKVLVFDDNSSDDTIKIAESLNTEVIKHDTHLGYGGIIKDIFSEASMREFDCLIILDSDAQHNPEDIPELVRPIVGGYDLVIGSRNKNEIPKFRYVGQRVLAFFTNLISKNKINDTQSGFRAYSKKAVESLKLEENGMAISSEIGEAASRIGLKIKEVPISVKYTNDSSTLNPIYQGGNTLTRVVVMISKRRPLLFFGCGGAALLVIGLVVGLNGYRMFIANDVLPVGSMLLSVLFVIIGILSIFTGIMLNAVKR